MANLSQYSGGGIARNDLARGFLFTKGIYRNNQLGEFVPCLSVDALSQDRGDVTTIECPSPDRYGEFIEIGTLPGELSRMSTTLQGRMSRTDLLLFYDLFINNCPFDLHLHFGLCQQPDAFNQYDKALIFEGVQATSFSTDPLVALQSGDRAVINESIDISIGKFYEVVNLSYGIRGAAVTLGDAIVSIDVCDSKNCGSECDEASDGLQRVYAASADYVVYFSTDGGLTWTSKVADAAPPVGETIVDAVCYKDDYVLLDSAGTFYIVNRNDLVYDTTNAAFGEVASGMGANAPTSMDTVGNFGLIVGENGTIALFTEPANGAVIVDAGFATSSTLNDVYISANEGIAVAVGAAGSVAYSYDAELWYTASTPNVALNLISVVAKSRNNWLVGSANGQIWSTDNAGLTWEQVKYPGSTTATAAINDIANATNHIMYFAGGAKVYRSIDGGASWTTEPNSKSEVFPTVVAINSIAVAHGEPNTVWLGGESATNTGVVVLGTKK